MRSATRNKDTTQVNKADIQQEAVYRECLRMFAALLSVDEIGTNIRRAENASFSFGCGSRIPPLVHSTSRGVGGHRVPAALCSPGPSSLCSDCSSACDVYPIESIKSQGNLTVRIYGEKAYQVRYREQTQLTREELLTNMHKPPRQFILAVDDSSLILMPPAEEFEWRRDGGNAISAADAPTSEP